jgi:hypothetical protein
VLRSSVRSALRSSSWRHRRESLGRAAEPGATGRWRPGPRQAAGLSAADSQCVEAQLPPRLLSAAGCRRASSAQAAVGPQERLSVDALRAAGCSAQGLASCRMSTTTLYLIRYLLLINNNVVLCTVRY